MTTIFNTLPSDTTLALRLSKSLRDIRAKPQQSNLPVPQDAQINQNLAVEDRGTRTIRDAIISNDNGTFKRARVFEQDDGRRFSKLEEVTFANGRIERIVYQQNPSGSVTRYEDIIDRQNDGAFRRTQRFQDESGETKTQITPDYTTKDAFILSGGRIGFSDNTLPSSSLRGSLLDLTA